ncbi:MAG: hypothetical protein COA96_06385 [SAR86 cluster bacterium]|uniref:Uncharacterized protein n=1 Tax=SAR86 cluster bacterium TaxID=2030880 RepID=A0A2A5B3F9_9GAMM|nr:MAG: hypothetical protein COA96_06385 [SAR86 cluster bacterium]
MPLTAVGKIFRPTLRQSIAEVVITELLQEQQIEASVSGEIDKKKGLVISISVDDSSKVELVKQHVQSYTFTTEVS